MTCQCTCGCDGTAIRPQRVLCYLCCYLAAKHPESHTDPTEGGEA